MSVFPHTDDGDVRDWAPLAYHASAAYQTSAQTGLSDGNQHNRHLERLWFSPHCVWSQPTLFDLGAAPEDGLSRITGSPGSDSQTSEAAA